MFPDLHLLIFSTPRSQLSWKILLQLFQSFDFTVLWAQTRTCGNNFFLHSEMLELVVGLPSVIYQL